MKTIKFSVCVVLLMLFGVMGFVSCNDTDAADNREQEYGYAQFKLYKKASYGEQSAEQVASTRAIKKELNYLSEASKIKVILTFEGTTIAQTLTLSAANEASAEYGMRSDKLKLLVGDYRLDAFVLYDAYDEELYKSSASDIGEFKVLSGGLSVHDVTINVEPRGQVKFSFKKEFAKATRAAAREYTFDEVNYVNINVAQILASGALSNPVKFEKLPVDFSLHLDTDKGSYQTSTLVCDTLVSLPAGNYKITSYETLDEDKKLLESNTRPADSPFEVSDNKITETDVKLTLNESDEYLKDYYALYEIWKALDGENWYYDGEEWNKGANWNFHKDLDLWGDQPGVQLHSNGRVAFIDISCFGFRGHMPAALGQLTELIQLYLGTHNDTNIMNYDPSLAMDQSLTERSRNRMENHRKYLNQLHTPTQVSEPVARALAENGISIPAMSLYETMGEREIFNMATGEQRNIQLMDTNHGTLCNGLRSLPKEIGNLKKLEYLYIANSEIESLPAEVAELESLTDIEIYNCPNMTQFPMAVCEMPELVSLNISNNAQWSAEEIYNGINGLATGPAAEKIQILYARQNKLEELPESFKNMRKIGLIDLAVNRIKKIHPFGKDIIPVQLYLDFNELESIPVDAEGYFCGYDDIENFSVKYNRLTKIPNIFSAKSNFMIKSVDFSGNNITGCEGEEDGSYKGINVETFTLAQNPTLKKYPKAFAETNSTIAYIILRACNLEEIPEGAFTYKNSVNMQSFDLSYNNLKKLPRDMHAGNFPYLYGVDLSFNSFSSFPFEPLDSSGLTVFAVRSQRNEKGERCLREWPANIGLHKGLRGLYLGSNDLRKIDDTISTLIYYLDISDNPNIIFDASDICYAWQVGAYILIYDKSQNILNCDLMLQ